MGCCAMMIFELDFLPAGKATRTPSYETVICTLRFLSLCERQSDRILRMAATISIREFGLDTFPHPTN